MKQLVIDYFNNEAESGDIQDHYEWFMSGAMITVARIVQSIGDQHKLLTSERQDLETHVRNYIDEMDDAAGNV